MLSEAVDIIAALFDGDVVTKRGEYYAVEHACGRPKADVITKYTRPGDDFGARRGRCWDGRSIDHVMTEPMNQRPPVTIGTKR